MPNCTDLIFNMFYKTVARRKGRFEKGVSCCFKHGCKLGCLFDAAIH